jgi:hypothetical protein
MKNSFGNYVVQKTLKLAKGSIKVKLINNIKKNIDKCGDNKLMNKWELILANENRNIYPYDEQFSDSVKTEESYSSISNQSKMTNFSYSIYNNQVNSRMYSKSGECSPKHSEKYIMPIRYPSDNVLRNLNNFK